MRKYAVLSILTAVMLFAFVACGGNEAQTTQQPDQSPTLEVGDSQAEQDPAHSDNGIFYQFDDLGFSFMLPSSWDGKYSIDLHENEYGASSVRVHHIATKEELGLDFAGMLFWINRFPSYDGMADGPIGLILAQAGGYTYAISYPQDSDHAYDSVSEAAVQYREMMEYLEPRDSNFIVNSFEVVPEIIWFTWERVGSLIFIRPTHWAGYMGQMEPHEGADVEFWDPEFGDDEPSLSVRMLPLDGTAPTLDELLAGMLAEERIEVTDAGIDTVISPIDVAFVFGININENDFQYGMYEYNIKFVYDGWLYIVTANYNDIYNHKYLITTMLQYMMVTNTLRDAEIEALYQRAVEAFSWFDMTTMPLDSRYRRVDEDGIEYTRVTAYWINTLADLEAYLHGIFTANVVVEMFNLHYPYFSQRYRDFDGVLYAIDADRGADITKGDETHEIIRESDDRIIYRVTVDVHEFGDGYLGDVIDTEVHEFILGLVDGEWLFSNFNLVR